jgi:predicted component of type VI protein secretion system
MRRRGVGRAARLRAIGGQLFLMDSDHSERIMRIEESHAFVERTLEQLHEELLTLSRRVDALTSRLAKAEASLAERSASSGSSEGAEDASGAGGIELPPHSHMPLDRQAGRTTDPFAPPSGAEPPASGGSR